jgi:hypothetical protein
MEFAVGADVTGKFMHAAAELPESARRRHGRGRGH